MTAVSASPSGDGADIGPGARFGRDARLLTPAAFERCLRRPALLRDGPFALHLCPPDVGSDAPLPAPCWRLGLVIPKRFEASAVARNTIKRRWRDAFRRGRAAWADEFGSADLVVRMQAPLVAKPPRAAKVAKSRRTEPVAGGTAPLPVVPKPLPAKVRARERFDPPALLVTLTARLRTRGFPPVRTESAGRASPRPASPAGRATSPAPAGPTATAG